MKRRHFLGALLLPLVANAMPDSGRLYFACAKRMDGKFLLIVFNDQFEVQHSAELPRRPHGLVAVPDGVIVVDRRPGKQIHHYSLSQKQLIASWSVPADFYLNGHGIWLNGTLWLTANRAIDSQGFILGLKDGQFRAHSTSGFGPHEVVSNRGMLYVANGGIKTELHSGNQSLGDNFQSFISVIDPAKGVIERWTAPEETRWLSQRHLAWHGDSLYVAGQTLANAPASKSYLLAYTHGQCRCLKISADDCQRYLGSVTSDGDNLWVSSPKANSRWRVDNGDIAVLVDTSSDLCALAGDRFFTGLGVAGSHQSTQRFPVAWDNHALMARS